MGSKPKSKMPLAERAKQFMPFSAVRGLTFALRCKEQELAQVPPKIVSEDAAIELDAKLRQLQKGSLVVITFFTQGSYQQISGCVICLDEVHRRLLLEVADGKQRIAFADIIDIYYLG